MSALAVVGIGLLGGLGAVGRFLVDARIGGRASTRFPLGTFVVNMTGAFALGILAGATTDETTLRLLATGLLGAYTTFSTWAFESERLGEDGALPLAASNFAVSLLVGVALAWAGTQLGGLL